MEEQLFKEWQQRRHNFVPDGVVSEKDYLKSELKIAFILKEVNGGKRLDLREYLCKGGRPRTWDNVSIWVHGIRQLPTMSVWDHYKTVVRGKNVSKEFRTKQLRSICAMNLKKAPGEHTSKPKELRESTLQDRQYIRRQYKLYDPHLTICGGTGDLFMEAIGYDTKERRETRRGIRWYKREPGKYIVHFAHPEARVAAPLLVYGLLDAVNEIMTQ